MGEASGTGRAVVVRGPFLPDAVAPDETWVSREDPPRPGMQVEGFWPGWKDRADQIARCSKSRKPGVWLNAEGLEVVFNPTFWRLPRG
jgi:hypothetical protein